MTPIDPKAMETLIRAGEQFVLLSDARKAIADEREACAKVCEAKIEVERLRTADHETRSAESEDAELHRLRHWRNVLLWNSAHEQMAAAIRARGQSRNGEAE